MATSIKIGRSKDPLIRVGGINGLANSLRKIGDQELSKEMKAVSKEAAQKIVPYAKARVPVDSGALQRSIKSSPTRRYARIMAGNTSKVSYSRAVHSGYGKGRKRVKGTPFIRLAIPEAWGEIKDEYIKGMNRIAKRFESRHGVSRVYGRYR